MHILLITRHYPPEISGGARRPSLYTQALRQLGHRVTVVTPFNLDDGDSIAVQNTAILNGLKALHETDKPSTPPGHITRLKNWLRIWAYWPDPNIQWTKDVVKVVKQSGLKPDWIMTTSPPESIHIAGAKLSKHMRLPWVAEMRDTWIENPHRKILAQSTLRAFLEKRLAKRTLSTAQALTSVSNAVISEGRKYVSHGTPECIISHFSNTPPKPYAFDASKLNFVHTGGFTLSDRRRKLPELLHVLNQIYLKRQNLVFHIAGPLSDEENALIKQVQMPIEWHGSVTLEKARALQAGADALILHTPDNSHALPGKYAEYAMARKPILYLGGGDWLGLVEDMSLLRPLKTGGLSVEKNEHITPSHALTDIQSAKLLVDFLNGLKT